MTCKPTSPALNRPIDSANNSWLFDEPELDEEGFVLLAAYHAAAEANRQTCLDQCSQASESALEASSPDNALSRNTPPRPGVRRLDHVAGVPAERFAGLHGQLLAAGYLTADVLGRSDGLSYRITREGLRRLAGDPHAEAA